MKARIHARSFLITSNNYVKVLKSNVVTDLIGKNSAMPIKFCTKKGNYVI